MLKTKRNMLKACPHCGSTNVEELLMGFFKANEDSLDAGTDGDVQHPDLYPDQFWCPDCERHPASLDELDPAHYKHIQIGYYADEDGAVRVYGHPPGNVIKVDDIGRLMPQVSEVDPRREAYAARLRKLGVNV